MHSSSSERVRIININVLFFSCEFLKLINLIYSWSYIISYIIVIVLYCILAWSYTHQKSHSNYSFIPRLFYHLCPIIHPVYIHYQKHSRHVVFVFNLKFIHKIFELTHRYLLMERYHSLSIKTASSLFYPQPATSMPKSILFTPSHTNYSLPLIFFFYKRETFGNCSF